MWFSKGNKSHLGKFTRKWFGLYKVQYVLSNDIMLLVTIEKFETNPMLVNVNKLKPYKYMESKVHKQKQQVPIYWEQNVGPDFRPKILIWRWKMKTMKLKNHRYVVMKMKNE